MADDPILEVHNLKKYFAVRTTFLDSVFKKQRRFVKAVDDVTFKVNRGELCTLAGESGCGKTTVAKTLVHIYQPTAGRIRLAGEEIVPSDKDQMRRIRRKIQMIFQDPYESLNPRSTIFDIVAEGLEINKIVSNLNEKVDSVSTALNEVGIQPPEDFFGRYPHELSGGQRQRVAIASVLALAPEVIIADEPVSMLDASIRAGILKIMFDLRKKFNLTFLFITHDLSLAYTISDKIAMMYLGRIVEEGSAREVIGNPAHPYTKSLVSVIPVPDPSVKRDRIMLKGEPPNPIDVPTGCRFHPRCPFKSSDCETAEPQLEDIGHEHKVACFHRYI